MCQVVRAVEYGVQITTFLCRNASGAQWCCCAYSFRETSQRRHGQLIIQAVPAGVKWYAAWHQFQAEIADQVLISGVFTPVSVSRFHCTAGSGSSISSIEAVSFTASFRITAGSGGGRQQYFIVLIQIWGINDAGTAVNNGIVNKTFQMQNAQRFAGIYQHRQRSG